MKPAHLPSLPSCAAKGGGILAKPAAPRCPRIIRWALLGLLATTACLGGEMRIQISPTREFRLTFDSEAQILFYPQYHFTKSMSARSSEFVTLSQYLLARFLAAHPDYEVFAEGGKDEGPAEAAEEDVARNRSFFPGLVCPEGYRDWNPMQEALLIYEGAPKVLRDLGLLPRIHAAAPMELEAKLHRDLDAHWKATGTSIRNMDDVTRDIVFTRREGAAADNVKAYLAAHPSAKVLLVYGAAHDFRKYFSGQRYAEMGGLEGHLDWKATLAQRARVAAAMERKEAGPREASRKPGDSDAFASLDALEEKHRTRLMNAITRGDLALVKTLLAQGEDVGFRDGSGHTALILAALGGHLAILEEVLKHVAPDDVQAPVTLVVGDVIHTYEDLLALLEDRDNKSGKDYFEVIQRLRAFSAPPARGPGGSPASSSPSDASRPARKAPREAAPGFLGDLGRYLPSWL